MPADDGRSVRPRGVLLERKTALLACLILTLLLEAQAQQEILFRHLTAKDGLSQGGVTCILQDREGFMWFGTQDGLNRYDGYDFKIFKHDPVDSTSLSDSWILALYEDTSGTLWARTFDNQLNRFDRQGETFTHFPRETVDLSGARRNSAKVEYIDPSGIRWTSEDLGSGLTEFDPATKRRMTFRHNGDDPGSLSDDRVYSVCRDHRGVLWVGTASGLDRLDPSTGKFFHYRHDGPNSLSDNWVWPILEDRQGVLWVGTQRGGLNRFEPETGQFTHYRHDEADPRSLAGDQVYSLYQDRSGMIWVGMNDHGVDRFQPELDAFEHYANEPGNSSSLINNNIISMGVDHRGVAWIGTRRGVERFDHSRRTFTLLRKDPKDPSSIGDSLAQTILEDRAGNVWIGMVSSGLDRYERRTGRFTHYRNDPRDPHSLSDNRVYALLEDRAGMIWVGTYKGGLNRLDPSTGLFTRYLHNDSLPGSLSAPGVFALLEDQEGRVWVGTFNGGLDRFDASSGTFVHFRHNERDPTSLSDNLVAALYEDSSGTVWAGTSGGLNRFNGDTSGFTHYRERDGLPNDVIFGILGDGHGNLWMSTNKGISRFTPRTGRFRNFDENDGLQADEFNQNAYARDPLSGAMYFGGPNGFNVFHPDSVRDNPYLPPVVFSSFTRYNTDDQEGKPIEERGIDTKSHITLSYKDDVVTFGFAALSFYNNSKNQYAYKLEGFADNWIQLGPERKATFTNLDAGQYRLLVKGSNDAGLWNEKGASLRLTVTPPWWKTRWAYALYGALAITFLYGVRRFELKRREQKAQVRESQLRAKAAEAEKRALEAENERKSKELEDARRLQLSMLPQDVPALPDYEIAVYMKTATEVGGDYYDFSVGEDGTLNIGLGDATGHGMQAGTVVTLMKGLFLADASRFDIQSFFSRSSRTIKEIRMGRLFMAFTLLRLKGNCVSFSTAGMPPVFLHRRENGEVEEILLKGMPLGAMKNFPYDLHSSSLGRGDTVLLLTDGLPEQKNASGEMFDYERVRSAFARAASGSPQEIIRELTREGESWMSGAVQEDDITMMVVRMKGPPATTPEEIANV